MNLKENLKRILQDRNIKLIELARMAEIPPTTLYSLFNRSSNSIRIETLEKIANALNVSITELREQEQNNSNIDEQKEMLLNNYYKLNSDGKSKLLERSAELTELKKYTK